MKNVILIGASGFVGSAILKEALSRGHKVTAIVRNPEKITRDSPLLTVFGTDATDPVTLAELAKGKDAVISAYNPGWANPRQYEETLENYPKIVEGVKRSGVKRLLIVGGAGTLFVKPGVRLIDTGTLPEAWLPGVKSLGEFYLNTLMKEKEIDWVFFSPAGNLGNMGPGIRTGKYRTGKDDMIFDDKGESFISVEDYAVAMIDELEQENHHRERFTAAYRKQKSNEKQEKKMKKIILTLAVTGTALGASAQDKGRFEVYDLGNFKLHVYYTNDALGDASYIIEGRNSLVTMEHPLFKENATEFDAYIDGLGKPVEQVITDYHEGSSGDRPQAMAAGMPAFMKGPIYGGMIEGFRQTFGDSMTALPTGEITEIPFGSTQYWSGISFEFIPGASSDFPAASILIGGKVYYTHWTPAKAHVSNLQINSEAAIDAEIAEARKSLLSGAEIFIGGHGGAATADAVEFKIAYLQKMKESLHANRTLDSFIEAMKEAYPNLPGTDGLEELAKALYNK